MSSYKYLCWVDLETAGLGDENIDPILEFAMVVTNLNLNELDSLEAVIEPDPRRYGFWEKDMPEIVKQMHTTNHLLEDIAFKMGSKLSHVETDAVGHLLSFTGRRAKKKQFLLAGSGVAHFDRRYLKAQMPEFHSWLAYPVLDVGIFRRCLQLMGRGDLIRERPEDKAHRAMDDIHSHIEEFKHYKDIMQNGCWVSL